MAVTNILQGIKQTLTDKSDRLNIYETHTNTHTHTHTYTHTSYLYLHTNTQAEDKMSPRAISVLVQKSKNEKKSSPFMAFLFRL